MEDTIDLKRLAQAWSGRLQTLIVESTEDSLQKEKLLTLNLLRDVFKQDEVGVFCCMSALADSLLESVLAEKKMSSELRNRIQTLEGELKRAKEDSLPTFTITPNPLSSIIESTSLRANVKPYPPIQTPQNSSSSDDLLIHSPSARAEEIHSPTHWQNQDDAV